MTELAFDLVLWARERFERELRKEPHTADDFPETLALARDTRLFTVAELADVVGLSKSRVYQLLEVADARKGE